MENVKLNKFEQSVIKDIIDGLENYMDCDLTIDEAINEIIDNCITYHHEAHKLIALYPKEISEKLVVYQDEFGGIGLSGSSVVFDIVFKAIYQVGEERYNLLSDLVEEECTSENIEKAIEILNNVLESQDDKHSNKFESLHGNLYEEMSKIVYHLLRGDKVELSLKDGKIVVE